MLRSLVGSEMCIRDSRRSAARERASCFALCGESAVPKQCQRSSSFALETPARTSCDIAAAANKFAGPTAQGVSNPLDHVSRPPRPSKQWTPDEGTHGAKWTPDEWTHCLWPLRVARRRPDKASRDDPDYSRMQMHVFFRILFFPKKHKGFCGSGREAAY